MRVSPFISLSFTFAICGQCALADCITRELGAFVSELVKQPESDTSRLMRLIIEDVDDMGQSGRPEVIVITEEVLRGGSDSEVMVDVYPGADQGVCVTPLYLTLQMNTAAPFGITFGKTEIEGHPTIEIQYEFEDSNAFGSYATSSAFVADERVETYVLNGAEYELTSQRITRCLECPEGVTSSTD